MPREGSADIILAKVQKRFDSLMKHQDAQLKGLQPFDSEKVTTEEQIWAIEQLTFQDLDRVAQEYGPEGVQRLQDIRQKYYQRRQK